MRKIFITNVNNDEALGLPATFGDETYPHHNSAFDDFDEDRDDVEEEEETEDALPLPASTLEDADFTMRGEPGGGGGEEPLPPTPSTVPARGRC